MSSIVLAIPPIPTKWWGTVSIDGSPVTEGVVRAYINNTVSATTTLNYEGFYAIDVPCLSGNKVVLKVYDIVSSGELNCSPGDFFNINMSVNTLSNGNYCEYNQTCTSGECINNFCSPYCGNSVCEPGAGENQTTCCMDCGCSLHEFCNTTSQCQMSPQCSDGTYYSECSATKPQYCSNGTLINNCTLCGCPSGQNCGSDGACSSSGGVGGPLGGGGGFVSSGSAHSNKTESEETTPEVPSVVETPEETTIPEGETPQTPEETAQLPVGPVGFFLGVSTTDWAIGIIAGIIIAAIIIFLLTKKRKK